MNMQQREEKQLEATVQAILNRVNDLKTAIQALITKLETEYETINWPTFLDNYAILSGHVSTITTSYRYLPTYIQIYWTPCLPECIILET